MQKALKNAAEMDVVQKKVYRRKQQRSEQNKAFAPLQQKFQAIPPLLLCQVICSKYRATALKSQSAHQILETPIGINFKLSKQPYETLFYPF